MKKLSARTYKIKKFFDYAGVMCLFGFLILIWQLYRAPLEVDFLKPYILRALNQDDSQYTATVDSVRIELVRSIKPIRIIAKDFVYKKNDGSFLVRAPKTFVSFSLVALLNGMIAPSSVTVNNPKIYIFNTYGVEKNKQNEVNKKKITYYFDNFENFLERFNAPDKTYVESYINELKIVNAEVELHEVDLGRKWLFSNLNHDLERKFKGIVGQFNGKLKVNDKETTAYLKMEFRPEFNKLAIEAGVNNLIPSEFAQTYRDYGLDFGLQHVKLPINLQISSMINFAEVLNNKENIIQSLDKAIEKISFQVEGKDGSIAFNDNADLNYKVSSVAFKGELEGNLETIKIAGAQFDLDNQRAVLSADISGVRKYILENDKKDLDFVIKANVSEMKIDDLSKYWPKYLGQAAWVWCDDSLSNGKVKNAEFLFNLGFDNKINDVVFKNLIGKGDLEDVSVDYLKGMPAVNNTNGQIFFAKDNIKIDIDNANSNDVDLKGGYVRLYDLNKDRNYADISLVIDGTIEDALKLINHPPLEFADEMGLKPDTIKGHALTDLGLTFELKKNLTPNEVMVNVKSELTDVVFLNAIKGKDVRADNLLLKVNNDGLDLEGKASLDGVDLDLYWHETFVDKTYNSKYVLKFVFDENLKKKLGLENLKVLKEPYVQGTPVVEAEIVKAGNNINIEMNVDMSEAKIDFAALGIKKDKFKPANMKISLLLKNDKLYDIPYFEYKQEDFELNGDVKLAKNQEVEQINIKQIKGIKTNAAAKIEFLQNPEIMTVNISGNEYNLEKLFEKNEEKIAVRKAAKKQGLFIKEKDNDDWEEKVKNSKINIAVNKLWTAKDAVINNFAGVVELEQSKGIKEMHMVGNFIGKGHKFLKFDYIPRNEEHLLSVESNDAGATLKFLRIYDNMRSGMLRIEAKRDKNKEMVGHALIREANLYNTPVLAKVLSLASLTSLVNLLTGDGIVFTHIDVPFEYKNKVLYVNEAKANAASIGINATGFYDRGYEHYDIKGVMVPLTGLNNLIKNIPLVGNLLAGKDGTVFAANYTIKGDADEPEIDINPLSLLSPSSLKDLMAKVFGNN